MPRGKESVADVANPPSPIKPLAPLPATTVTRPVLAVTFRILWVETMKRFPAASAAKSSRLSNLAAVAAIPSTMKSPELPSDPATVDIVPSNVRLSVCNALASPKMVAPVLGDSMIIVKDDTTSNNIVKSRSALKRIVLKIQRREWCMVLTE